MVETGYVRDVRPCRWWSGSGTAALTAAVVALVLHVPHWQRQGFQEDELACEEAMAHVTACCGTLPPGRVSCRYDEQPCTECESSCGPDIDYTYPEISSIESRCLRSRSCHELRTLGVCADALDPAGGGLECR